MVGGGRGGEGGRSVCWGGSVVVMDFFLTGVVFFYKLTRNLYLTIFYFFFSWGGGGEGRGKGRREDSVRA